MHVGALESTGDVLWFLRADTIPPPHALEHIRKSLETRSSVGGNFGLLFNGPSRAARQLLPIRCCASLVYATAIRYSSRRDVRGLDSREYQ